jgi:hypothetical protein
MSERHFGLRVPAEVPQRMLAAPRPAPGEHFLKGRIPRAWLDCAMRLPGKALHVALVLWYRAGLTGQRDVVLSLSSVASIGGFDRATASRGLCALESAGLVRVGRHVGRAPRVAILECVVSDRPARPFG